MPVAPLPGNEKKRLEALLALEALDGDADPVLDDLVQAARRICGASAALVGLIDSQRHWYAARAGVDATESSREQSFCSHLLPEPGQPIVVEDARQDPRFSDYGAVLAEPGIRFYAGYPLLTDEQLAVGSLCVFDKQPKTLTPAQSEVLASLARAVMARLQDRQRVIEGARSQKRLRMALDSAQLGLWEITVASGRLRVEGRFEQLLGLADGAFDGTTEAFLASVHGDDRERLRDELLRVEGHQDHQTAAFRIVRPDGEIRWLKGYARIENDAQGRVRHVVGLVADETARHEMDHRLVVYQNELIEQLERTEKLSLTDALTELPNRRAVMSELAALAALAARHGASFAVLVLDVDHFKSYNDGHGHPAGDAALKDVARLIREVVRTEDFAARLGGEEFVVLAPQTDAASAMRLAERIRAGIADADWPLRPVTLSIGIAVSQGVSGEAERLLVLADRALYRAKGDGRNCWKLADELDQAG